MSCHQSVIPFLSGAPLAKKNPGLAPGVNEGFGCDHRVCSFGMIRIRISDQRSLGHDSRSNELNACPE